ncbi:MAG: DUF1598 domain-containing protein [Pirellula sp.]|nr:DUF1598 domain-containing protein [Pirellula sp.]
MVRWLAGFNGLGNGFSMALVWLAIAWIGLGTPFAFSQGPGESSSFGDLNRKYLSATAEERIGLLESIRAGELRLGDRNPAGGASLANYDELIRLIESTIDGDWLINGGTSTIMPYRNGVRISTEGLVERIAPVEQSSAMAKARQLGRLSWEGLGEWQKPSSLRWVSLHEIDRMLQVHRDSRKPGKLELELLGGIVRIDYLAWDEESKQWLVGGPAGNLVPNQEGELVHEELQLPPVLLEDLITVAPHVLRGLGEFGCSIDPDNGRLQQAYEYAMQPGTQRSLQRSPDRWVEGWRKQLGPQKTTIVGLPADSPTAFALLKADAEMKMLGLGLLPLPPSVRSYWQESELLHSKSPSGLVRWWFTLSDAKIPYDADRAIYKISVPNVKVLSEAQFINEQGSRVVSTIPDIAADAFATQFTKQHEAIQRHSIVQARLRHIFDLAVVFEIIRHELTKGRGDDFMCLGDLSIQPRMPRTPLEIESVASTHKAKDGTRYAVVSGGVAIRPQTLTKRLSRGVVQQSITIQRDRDDKSSFWTEDLGTSR